MKTKVTLLSFLVYTAVSGQEKGSTNGLATLDSSRSPFSWLCPIGSSRIARAPILFLSYLRATTSNETHTNLRGHSSISPDESTYSTLVQHKREEQNQDDETPRRQLSYSSSLENTKKKIKKLKSQIQMTEEEMYELVGKARNALKYRLIDLRDKLRKQKQILRKKKQLNKNTNQQGTKSNEAPCAGSTMSICYIFNLFGYDTSSGSTNENGGSTNGNGDSTNENGWNGSQENANKILETGEEPLEPTTTTETEETEYTPTYEWIKLDDRQHRAYDYFGRSVAIDENTIVVGAPSDDQLAWQHKGFASVFYQGASKEWNLQQDLPTPEGVKEGDLFGYSVAIHGNVIVVGAPLVGIVQIYTRAEPGEVFTKSGSPLQSHKTGKFGESVAVFGNTVIVGAPTENHSGRIKAGSVYVYERNGDGWDYKEELQADSPSNNEYFGKSVSIYHRTIIVGMSNHGSFEKGGAQIFQRDGNTWDYDGLPISTGVGSGEGHYGKYVDIHREIVAVGGDLVPPKVFEKDFTDNWVPLGYSSVTNGGTAVAVDHDKGNNDDILVVGGYNKVKIFYHEDNQWNEREDGAVPTAPYSVDDGDAFGASVAISEGYVVAGAPMTHTGGLSPVGDVFVLDLNVDTSTGNGNGGDEYDY